MNWLPFVYQYSFQALFFIIGMLLAFKSGQLNLRQRRGRFYFFWMILTFLAYFSFQGFLQFVLPYI